LFTIKKIIFYLVFGAAVYYGWPIIEALYIILPIPDIGFAGEKVKNVFLSLWSTIVSIPVLGELLNSLMTIVNGLLGGLLGSGSSS